MYKWILTWKKNFGVNFFFLFYSIYQNVHLGHKKIWIQFFDISKGQATIRIGNPAHHNPLMCRTLSPYCDLVFWDIKKLRSYFFMPQVYILFYARNLEIKSDEIFLFVRVPPMNFPWNIGFQKKFKFSNFPQNYKMYAFWCFGKHLDNSQSLKA